MNGKDGLSLRLVSGRKPWVAVLEQSQPEPPTVYVVEDDPESCKLLTCQLAPLNVPVKTFCSAEEFLLNYSPNSPGCLLLDIQLPGMDGFALQAVLNERHWRLPVIFVTGYADVARARQALLAGAVDFLEKPVERRHLLQTVNEALNRDRERRRSAATCACLSSLTEREWDVLRLVVAGKANKVISADLSISQKTVEVHRARVMSKTNAGSVADLVRIVGAFEALAPASEASRKSPVSVGAFSL